MKRALFSIVVCALLLSCERAERKPVYAGKSAHWDQQQTPISLQCAACHAKQFEEWAGSDHAWAWRKTDAALDSEPFHRQELQAHGDTLSFDTTPQGGHLIRFKGKEGEFRVDSVVGRTPLVQYLVKGKDGALQTPSAAWDVEKHEWFDIFDQDVRLSAEGLARRDNGDWGHWLGRGMNWNSQCAWCHMSGFRKNYDEATDSYHSSWKEPGVTCIQCHRLAPVPDAVDGCLVQKQDRKLSAELAHDNCASCHARREELDDAFCAGELFHDHFRLELPIIPGIFWPNGMQRDEDYCETGLQLSRMGAAGVSCLDCHDPHSAQLKLPQEDNSLCLRCHEDGTKVNGIPAPVVTHAPEGLCPAGSMGGRCVECHMPATPYMARDMRRDHSFNIPDPALSVELGIPNACTMCHADKSPAWAELALEKALPAAPKAARYRLRTRAVQAALEGCECAEDLLAALREESVPAWRATLLELLARQPVSPDITDEARRAAKDASPMVRAAAARLLGAEASALLNDPVRLVRHAAAWALAVRNYSHLLGTRALHEIEASARHQADQPTGTMQLATLAAANQNVAEACRRYERAIQLDPASPVPYMDYAVYLDSVGKPQEALKQMLACIKVVPENADAHYRLALVLAELRQFNAACAALVRALKLNPNHAAARAAYDELLLFLNQSR